MLYFYYKIVIYVVIVVREREEVLESDGCDDSFGRVGEFCEFIFIVKFRSLYYIRIDFYS